MHANKERLIRIGNAILSASRNELYLSMRFLDLGSVDWATKFLFPRQLFRCCRKWGKR